MKPLKYCPDYTGVACVDGSCPKANEENNFMTDKDYCRRCLFYEGCQDCYFCEENGDCRLKHK